MKSILHDKKSIKRLLIVFSKNGLQIKTCQLNEGKSRLKQAPISVICDLQNDRCYGTIIEALMNKAEKCQQSKINIIWSLSTIVLFGKQKVINEYD